MFTITHYTNNKSNNLKIYKSYCDTATLFRSPFDNGQSINLIILAYVHC